ncbi:MAG: hypothetical protein M3082_14970 [Candidatus Dormibacteraeota bacterium]|nr:hypothetical protein [Candidatus Dormibacteraeota bacterium]
MDALTLVKQADAAGLRIRVDGDKLVVNGARRAEALVRQLLDNKPAVIVEIRKRWDGPLADALIQIALERVSRAYDELAPGCPVGARLGRSRGVG